MEPREKPDSYGEWAIRRVQQEAGEHGNLLPAEVITAARMGLASHCGGGCK
jgi:hypothetical protein